MFSKFGLKQFAPLAISALTLVSSAFAANAYINQIGYRPADNKEFVVDGVNGGNVEIVDQAGQTVLMVTPSAATSWDAFNQQVQLVDFSDLKTPGTYSIKVGGQVVRNDLKIADKTFEDVAKASLKWFYYQRASMALDQTYAGQWKRSAGHTNGTVEKHQSAGSGTITSTKGWYDAGDYGRYIVNSGITTYTLLSLYEHYPDYFNALKWNIPAEGALPDLLAEIKYNLDWMLTMQDTDGGVFHKLTTLGFPGDVMPAGDKDKLYVIGKGTAATFDFAAVMATAARVYKPFDATFAATCLSAARDAYTWGSKNPNITFSNPNGVFTGEYGDSWLVDEKAFASTELFITTGEATYKSGEPTMNIPSWADVSGLATYDMAIHATEFGDVGHAAHDSVVWVADDFVNRTASGFGVVMQKSDFVWGSNAVAANQGVWLLHAYYLTGEEMYYTAAKKVLDYLLGKNPLNMSFLTGYGTKSPRMPHHRPSTADNISDPVPGMLVGGPQPGGEDIGSETWECKDYRTGQAATSYTDNRCSYATNEVAINWNAPLAYLAGALEALNAGHKPSFAIASHGDAIKPSFATRRASSENQVRLRFADQKVYIEKAGKRFDLKGNHLK